ncbi:MAG: Gfo/Idh/MocA family oxidoreductase [Planctomycetia bacterium]|nr:Gfo/Idh/MocA family oxidoreductase [Planctomycetia bacterium]
MATVRAAVVGTGFIGPVHVEALRRAGVEVVGILGSTPEKSRQAARRLGIATGYESYAELLADDRVGSVHIASPNRFHFEQAAAALRAGLNVMCEKPLAMNAQESAELVKIAARAGVASGVCYNVRYYPLCREAAQTVRAGTLGRPLCVFGSYVQDWLLRQSDFNWRVLAEDGGELRAVADIGTHWLDLVQHILGQEVIAVCADLHTVHPHRRRPAGGARTFSGPDAPKGATQSVPITTEDYGTVMLRFTGEMSGCLFVSQVTAGRKNCLRFEIAGSNSALAWDSERPNELWTGRRDGPNEILLRDPALMSEAAAAIADYPGGHNEGFPDTFKQLFREFYAYIERGDFSAPPPFPTFADGHHEIALCRAILRSHRERRWVEVET